MSEVFLNSFIKIENGRYFLCRNKFPYQEIYPEQISSFRLTLGPYAKHPTMAVAFGLILLALITWFLYSMKFVEGVVAFLDDGVMGGQMAGMLILGIVFLIVMGTYSIWNGVRIVILMRIELNNVNVNSITSKMLEYREILALLPKTKLIVDPQVENLVISKGY